MVLTDRQRFDLHVGIYEYLKSRPGEAFEKAAAALREADPSIDEIANSSNGTSKASATPLLEKKWTAIPRLQKRVLELERLQAQSAKIHAHRGSMDEATGSARRMLPRPPCIHKLSGHSQVVTAVAVHPVFTMVASGSEDGTIKVSEDVCCTCWRFRFSVTWTPLYRRRNSDTPSFLTCSALGPREWRVYADAKGPHEYCQFRHLYTTRHTFGLLQH